MLMKLDLYCRVVRLLILIAPECGLGRLTAYELQRAGIPYTLICDNMAATLMRQVSTLYLPI
jgi:hypothetical protein